MRSTRLNRREYWEYEPTPQHRSLVLMLYRKLLKELLQFQSRRKKSLIAYCRLAFRKRAKATEKLLIDECIEEARRSIYVLDKHNQMGKTKEFKFDDMGLPQDTGQDVKTYMEEVFDPAAARGTYGDLTHDSIAPNEAVQMMKDAEKMPHQAQARSSNLWGSNESTSSVIQRRAREAEIRKQMEEKYGPTSIKAPPPPSAVS